MNENSELVAYATQWERSSFLFGYLESALGFDSNSRHQLSEYDFDVNLT